MAAVLALGWAVERVGVDAKGLARVVPAYCIGTVATYWLMQRVELIFATA